MAAGVFGAFKGIDAFAKTVEDVKVKTRAGALLTLLSALFIVFFTLVEYADFRSIHVDSAIIVDRSKGEKLRASFNMTFPRVPCYLLSLDVTDVSGATQREISHHVVKTRLDSQSMRPIYDGKYNLELKSDVDKIVQSNNPGYCGSCYGGAIPEGGCCQTCDDVRKSYMDRGWAFNDPDVIEQCQKEKWTEKLHAQAHEGCNIAGSVLVNKVNGNIQFSPGRSFVLNRQDVYEVVPYLKDANHYYGHFINSFSFEAEWESQYVRSQLDPKKRKLLGIERGPLDEIYSHVSADTSTTEFMFQYFLKVVSTKYVNLQGHTYDTHQYSASSYERDLKGGAYGKNDEGVLLVHERQGLPGAFFNVEISPMQVIHFETKQSFAHFATSLMVIIGGVLTVATLADTLLFRTQHLIKKGQEAVAAEKHANGGRDPYSRQPIVQLR